MTVRRTEEKDVAAAAEIYKAAREFMKANGNPDQWSINCPDEESIRRDMSEKASYVLEDAGETVAVFYFKKGDDPTYKAIYGGAWLNNEPYAVIHRIAVKYQGRGLVGACFDEAYRLSGNVRIDTHRDNLPMQRALTKRGFKYCGIIHLENGEERLAYQRI